MVEKGDDETFRGLKSGQNQCVCVGWFVSRFCWLTFQEKVPWFLGTPKNYNSPLKLQVQSYKERLWFFVRLFEVVIKGSGYVLSSYFSILSNGTMVSETLDYVICVGWGIYVIECRHELEFLWMSNVVLGLCGLKISGRWKKANGLKREKSERSNPLETSSFSLMKKAISYVLTRQNLDDLLFMPVWNSKNVFAIQYVDDLYYVCLAPLFFLTLEPPRGPWVLLPKNVLALSKWVLSFLSLIIVNQLRAQLFHSKTQATITWSSFIVSTHLLLIQVSWILQFFHRND
jgi:hypothetical protein